MKLYGEKEWGEEQRSQQSLCASPASENSEWHMGPSSVRHAVRCTECFLLREFYSLSPRFFSVRSSLSYLICSYLNALHGRIRNQVTNRAPLCFIDTALFMPRLLSLSNVSRLFQDTCFQDNTRPLQHAVVFLHYERDWCDVRFPFLPKRKRHFYLLKRCEGVFFIFIFYRGAENEQAVSAALTDGHKAACSISLYVVQISVLYVCVFFSLSLCLSVRFQDFRVWIILKCNNSWQLKG